MDKVETFYLEKHAIILRMASLVYESYGTSLSLFDVVNLNQADPHEIGDLLGCSVEVLDGLERLQRFGKANRDGFRYIFRKIDKVRLPSNPHLQEGNSKLLNSQFASQRRCLEDLERINKCIVDLSRARVESQSSSTHVSLFLHSFRARFYSSFLSPNAAYLAILEDDISALDYVLREQYHKGEGPTPSYNMFLIAMLQFSVLRGSKNCVEKLLSLTGSLTNMNLHDGVNCFHCLPISVGRRLVIKDQQRQRLRLLESIESLENNRSLLAYILSRLSTSQHGALEQKDSFGRLPLHYAAMYGLLEMAQTYLKCMQTQRQFSGSAAADAVLLQDSEGYTPLHLGVLGGYPSITKLLLEVYEEGDDRDEKVKDRKLQTVLGPLLRIALLSDSIEIAQILIAHRVNINHQGLCGETAIYTAAKNGRVNYVKALIELSSSHSIDFDLRESVRGWTPLFIACVEGHLPVIKLLLDAGANPRVYDFSGWTVKEHAVFRGHMRIASWLTKFTPAELDFPFNNVKSVAVVEFLGPGSNGVTQGKYDKKSSLMPPRASSHQFQTNKAESQILFTLGPSNTRTSLKAVELSTCLPGHPYAAHPETGYSLEIGVIGATGSKQVIQLPMLEDMTNAPWVFRANDLGNVKIVFDVFRITNYSGRDNAFVGSGVALLHSLKEALRLKHESLKRDYTVPILEKATLKLIGSVTFSVLVATPFPHPTVNPIATRGFWKNEGPIQVVGHRGDFPRKLSNVKNTKHCTGSGANSIERTNLQIGENTVQVSKAVFIRSRMLK